MATLVKVLAFLSIENRDAEYAFGGTSYKKIEVAVEWPAGNSIDWNAIETELTMAIEETLHIERQRAMEITDDPRIP